MASSLIKEGSSLFNFVVKEGNGIKGLVDSGLTVVPCRYIQPPHQRIHKQKSSSTPETTTIDLSQLDGPNHDQVIKAIAHAAETLGFFQVVNHGVPLELLDSLKESAHRFFSQPTEKKAVYQKDTSFVRYGTSFLPEIEETWEWKDYVGMLYTNDADALEFWPKECKEVALEYIRTSKEMVKRILQGLIANLGVKVDDLALDTFMGDRKVHMNFYPACPNPELTVGVGRHSDWDTLTVLLQDHVGGLYMKNDEGSSPEHEEWIEIPPIHGALIINVGDALQIMSNGRYKSAEHKVRTTSTSSRVSIAIFNSPDDMAKIGPFRELVASDGVARYRDLIFQEYKHKYFDKPHGGEKSLDFASI
ncbi:hypothetical protein LXL04_027096 [Taraxacum kok-saghyz]